jgi:hypothetical protein
MSDLIPELQTVIGWFMIATGTALGLVIIEIARNYHKR